ncbi:farnesyl pyrophosphate synthase-like [Gordionus sp. m RMFG-2023]|uniref:farnesyl pyrophosphate synthase-like n=1 Tax=Gordionus sp. m RMFG-2023 TaxID=3053472 RepID=UPI0031FBB274
MKNEIKFEDKHLKGAMILGWCVELLQAFFLVADDIMDNSITRRGRLCWYQNEHVGNIAINDSLFMESSIFSLLRKHFRSETFYTDILELFLETINHTIYGQSLDVLTPINKNFLNFTLDRYEAIVKYKTTYYSFYLPIILAFHLAGLYNDQNKVMAKKILYYMGYYFQVQDDYLDCYGDANVTGKIGTDIEDFKCSWLIVTALTKATEEQIQTLKDNYGKADKDCVGIVKSIYRDLKMEEHFKEFEERTRSTISNLIENGGKNLEIEGPLPKNFCEIVDNIFTFENDVEKARNNEKDGATIPPEVFRHYARLIFERVR